MKIGALFMGVSKAFDCLPHGLLIAKPHAYGLSTAACHLMFSYLKGRRQRVKISNSRSSWKLLTKGVPQGSILGPFLFNVFMNDLFLFIQNCKLYNYADYNSMIYSSPDINAILTNLKHDCKMQSSGLATTAWRQILTNFNSWCCHLTLWNSKRLKLKTT